MNSLGQPDCVDELECVRDCPALRAALIAGDFQTDYDPWSRDDATRKVERIARYRYPDSRETYLFSVQPAPEPGRWYAWGDYSPWGNKVTDACYGFLNGGGSFNSRSAAVWAIHTYIAHLTADDTKNEVPHSSPAFAAA
jgi:hypothetical protein